MQHLTRYAPGEPRTDELLDALLELWKASVRATHHFLTERDVLSLAPFCRRGLETVELFVIDESGRPTAFMGIAGDKIEMLFVAPPYFRRGLGQRLIRLAIDECHVRRVDVNEQNPNALACYRKMGFRVFERTATDEQGNPFPILKLKR